MRALVVGAGAVGQVLGRHLALGGAEVSFLVKEPHRAELRGGLTLFPLNRRGPKRPVRWAGFGVLSSAAEAAASPWDQIFLGVSSASLRAGAWLEELARATGAATLVSLQPGLGDGAFVAERVEPGRVVTGLTAFLGYSAPLPGERDVPEPGLAYWFPPLSRSAFSGPTARAAAVVAALRAGGLPAASVPNARRLSVVPSALFTGFVAALELAGWTFRGLRERRWLALASAAAREAVAIGAREVGSTGRLLAALLASPLVVRAVLRLAPPLLPFDLESYARVHFTKVGAQTPLAFEDYLEAGRRLGLPTVALEELGAALRAARG